MTSDRPWNCIDDRDLPDWKDGGRAEFKRSDKSIVAGHIAIEMQFTGEDEIPSAVVTLDDGTQPSIHDFSAWRLVRL